MPQDPSSSNSHVMTYNPVVTEIANKLTAWDIFEIAMKTLPAYPEDQLRKDLHRQISQFKFKVNGLDWSIPDNPPEHEFATEEAKTWQKDFIEQLAQALGIENKQLLEPICQYVFSQQAMLLPAGWLTGVDPDGQCMLGLFPAMAGEDAAIREKATVDFQLEANNSNRLRMDISPPFLRTNLETEEEERFSHAYSISFDLSNAQIMQADFQEMKSRCTQLEKADEAFQSKFRSTLVCTAQDTLLRIVDSAVPSEQSCEHFVALLAYCAINNLLNLEALHTDLTTATNFQAGENILDILCRPKMHDRFNAYLDQLTPSQYERVENIFKVNGRYLSPFNSPLRKLAEELRKNPWETAKMSAESWDYYDEDQAETEFKRNAVDKNSIITLNEQKILLGTKDEWQVTRQNLCHSLNPDNAYNSNFVSKIWDHLFYQQGALSIGALITSALSDFETGDLYSPVQTVLKPNEYNLTLRNDRLTVSMEIPFEIKNFHNSANVETESIAFSFEIDMRSETLENFQCPRLETAIKEKAAIITQEELTAYADKVQANCLRLVGSNQANEINCQRLLQTLAFLSEYHFSIFMDRTYTPPPPTEKILKQGESIFNALLQLPGLQNRFANYPPHLTPEQYGNLAEIFEKNGLGDEFQALADVNSSVMPSHESDFRSFRYKLALDYFRNSLPGVAASAHVEEMPAQHHLEIQALEEDIAALSEAENEFLGAKEDSAQALEYNKKIMEILHRNAGLIPNSNPGEAVAQTGTTDAACLQYIQNDLQSDLTTLRNKLAELKEAHPSASSSAEQAEDKFSAIESFEKLSPVEKFLSFLELSENSLYTSGDTFFSKSYHALFDILKKDAGARVLAKTLFSLYSSLDRSGLLDFKYTLPRDLYTLTDALVVVPQGSPVYQALKNTLHQAMKKGLSKQHPSAMDTFLKDDNAPSAIYALASRSPEFSDLLGKGDGIDNQALIEACRRGQHAFIRAASDTLASPSFQLAPQPSEEGASSSRALPPAREPQALDVHLSETTTMGIELSPDVQVIIEDARALKDNAALKYLMTLLVTANEVRTDHTAIEKLKPLLDAGGFWAINRNKPVKSLMIKGKDGKEDKIKTSQAICLAVTILNHVIDQLPEKSTVKTQLCAMHDTLLKGRTFGWNVSGRINVADGCALAEQCPHFRAFVKNPPVKVGGAIQQVREEIRLKTTRPRPASLTRESSQASLLSGLLGGKDSANSSRPSTPPGTPYSVEKAPPSGGEDPRAQPLPLGDVPAPTGSSSGDQKPSVAGEEGAVDPQRPSGPRGP